MEIQWYPGQMTRATRQLVKNLKLVDAVIEVLDARLPASSQNPVLKEQAAGKTILAVLTRADLAAPAETEAWLSLLRGQYHAVLAVNAASGEGVQNIISVLREISPASKERKSVRIIVAGVPNVGKSSLVNRLAGRSAAATGNKPGITRGQQWIRLRPGLEMLDTPGILWPKINSGAQGTALAAAGIVKDELLDMTELGVELIALLQQKKAAGLQQRYELDSQDAPPLDILAAIGRKRGCLVKGGQVDLGKAARLLVRDFRAGKLGRITLDDHREWGNKIE